MFLPGLEDFVGVVVVELWGLEDVLEVVGFEQPPLTVCMYLLKALPLLSLSLLFGKPPAVLCHRLLN